MKKLILGLALAVSTPSFADLNQGLDVVINLNSFGDYEISSFAPGKSSSNNMELDCYDSDSGKKNILHKRLEMKRVSKNHVQMKFKLNSADYDRCYVGTSSRLTDEVFDYFLPNIEFHPKKAKTSKLEIDVMMEKIEKREINIKY